VTYLTFGVDVLGPDGNLVHVKGILDNLPQRYIDAAGHEND
jgi:hypothetical protein